MKKLLLFIIFLTSGICYAQDRGLNLGWYFNKLNVDTVYYYVPHINGGACDTIALDLTQNVWSDITNGDSIICIDENVGFNNSTDCFKRIAGDKFVCKMEGDWLFNILVSFRTDGGTKIIRFAPLFNGIPDTLSNGTDKFMRIRTDNQGWGFLGATIYNRVHYNDTITFGIMNESDNTDISIHTLEYTWTWVHR